MALPIAPTIATVLTEAYTRGGIPTPTTAQLTRAEDEWLQEVLQDLSTLKGWNPGEDTQVVLATQFVQSYSIPSPLYRMLEIRWFQPGLTGTASAGAAGTITLATGLNVGDVEGHKIFTTGGTGSGQVRRATDYNSGTGVATITPNWTTTPDGTTTYMVPFAEWELVRQKGLFRGGTNQATDAKHFEEFEHEFLIDPIPDTTTRVMEVRGFVDLMLVDETDARWTRVLREWREPIIKGLMMRMFEDHDDDNREKYEELLDKAKFNTARRDSRRKAGPLPGFRSIGGIPRRRG